ncbi:fibroblast growth factor receptor-like isoform X3 [Montipora foliosa]|uniref:fibroblast growth factor receptor-like isoform X3 n=1 Tax=Montipora foliosa TaxID=591990 RepID=UPI0035F1E88C
MSKIKIFERYWSSSKGLSADLECIIFKSNASCSFWDKADYESIKQESQVTITPHFSSPVLVFEGEPLTLKWTFSIQGGSFRRVEFQTSGASVPIIEASLSGNPVTIDDRVSVNITATDVTIMFRTVDTKDSNNYTLVVLADGPRSGIADMKIIVQESQVTITPHFSSPVLVLEGRPVTLKWTYSIQGDSFRRVEFRISGASVPIIEVSLSGNPFTFDDRVSVNITATYLTIMFRTVDTKDSNNYTLVVLANGPTSGTADMKIIVQGIGEFNIYLRLSTSGECKDKDSVWETLENELDKVFAQNQSYIGAELIASSCGSLIFDLALKFNTKVAEDDIISAIKNAIVDGKHWNIGIPPVILSTTTASTTTSPESDSDNTWIIVGGVLGAVALSVIIAVTVWCVRKKEYSNETKGTGGQKRAYQESAYDNAPGNTHLVEMVNVGNQQPTPRNDLQEGQYAPLNPSTCSWEIPRHHVTIEKIIGQGAFGQVAKATADGLRGMPQKTLVAVKMTKADAPESDKKDLLSELEVMKTLKPHPHVIKLIGCVTQSEPLLVLIEYVPFGDLLGYLRKSRGLHDTYYKDPDIKPQTSLTSQQLMKFAWQIADGMKYLSSRSIIHRDLAARNVLVGERETSKVTDFGMARDVRQENIYERKTKGRLPVKWTAYEALMFGTYTTKSDVWSFGVLLYEIFTIGGSPYPRMDGRKVANLLQEGYRMPKPQHVDNELYEIMTSCWLEDSNARPTFLDLKNKLKNMENQHKRLINMDIYDNTQWYANVEDLAA